MSKMLARTKHFKRKPTKQEPLFLNPDPAEETLFFLAEHPKQAWQLLKSEAERLLEEGWEVIQISKRSYIAVQDGCEIYLHTCKKGVSARVFQYDNQ
mgnify:CR=1 FL=1|jgi:hypothetical protein